MEKGPNRVLHIEPRNGLCNRMRALDSACELAQACGREVVLHWVNGAGLNCDFERLFVKPACVKRVITWSAVSRGSHTRRWLWRKWGALRGERVLLQQDVDTMLLNGKEFADLEGPSIYIATGSRFFQGETLFETMIPAPAIADRVRTLEQELDLASCIGVHIRRKDHKLSREVSTTDAFAAVIQSELHSLPNARFFIATDDPEEEILLRSELGDRASATSKRSVDRSEPEAAEDALVDLLCLSRTRKLLGSYWSSFSVTASQLRGIPLEVIR